jgi:uncharacterized protein
MMATQQHTGNPGNFAEDREKASRAGRVGGQHSSGNFANNRERAAEAGRKGGLSSHGGGHPGAAKSQEEQQPRTANAADSPIDHGGDHHQAPAASGASAGHAPQRS